ncbi:S-adenosylmethionine:tRNA ribosyltransferase-isomerase [Porphyromonas sp.]|uniref:S-adenosylmethionine:tRNA ribosyltransferase-isomerase n=1 Tax=Porphyromonas sp. TaxID=1924944 RepID=UPI0026DCC0EE|nr:S-adenosylmethionine:tRNA ribosyltransferase-isomerase [Porphyromonas sp.]MDO4771135.1 S-adenosylmethionine:tRNA ribosyltransferase-isomerase [Porphyromonas sp.]
MQNYKNTKIEAFTYTLPDERIAKYPLSRRDESKLLIYSEGKIEDRQFKDIADAVPAGTLMVFNDTKVIRARLEFFKATGGRIEIFLLDPVAPSVYETVFEETNRCVWHCLVGNAKKWKEEDITSTFNLPDGREVSLTATKVGQPSPEGQSIALSWTGGETFGIILEGYGELPIPPYLNRHTEESDLTTYQTLFARVQGSVAAPTAGLHFTPEVMESLKSKGVDSTRVTLHVGAGTFRPVKSETMGSHTMHTEAIVIPLATLKSLRESLGHIMSVGTTSTRTLESLYYIGVHILEGRDNPYEVEQWEPYERGYDYTTAEALTAIIDHLESSREENLVGATRIIIVPGFQFRLVDMLVTNFHQPHSTLLLLIAAFVGEGWRQIYDHALASGYRFLSYGDSSLLFRKPL